MTRLKFAALSARCNSARTSLRKTLTALVLPQLHVKFSVAHKNFLKKEKYRP